MKQVGRSDAPTSEPQDIDVSHVGVYEPVYTLFLGTRLKDHHKAAAKRFDAIANGESRVTKDLAVRKYCSFFKLMQLVTFSHLRVADFAEPRYFVPVTATPGNFGDVIVMEADMTKYYGVFKKAVSIRYAEDVGPGEQEEPTVDGMLATAIYLTKFPHEVDAA